MSKKLDKTIIDEQKAMILDRIDQYETKKQQNKKIKPFIAIAAVLLIFMIPMFTQNNHSFGITQINANEYTLNLFGDKVHFRLYAFVENPNKIAINDEVSYYEGFQQYYDVTHQLTLEPLEVGDYQFLKMLKGDEVLNYLYVDTTSDQARSVTLMDKSFTNFEAQMEQIIKNVEQYPYDITLNDETGPSVKEHPDAKNLAQQDYEDYMWFKELQVNVYSFKPIDEYELIVYFDGSKEEVGDAVNMTHVLGRHNETLPFLFNPYTPSSIWDSHEENGVKINLTKYLFENKEPLQWASGAKIDFGKLNPNDYEIKLKLNNETIEPLTQLVDNQTVYLITDFLTLIQREVIETMENGQLIANLPYSMDVEIQIIHKQSNQILVQYEDSNVLSSSKGME